MKVLLVLLGCVAYAAASQLDCGPIAALKVKAQWAHVYGHTSEPREQFGHEVFDFIFDHEPKTLELFTRVRGDNIYSPEFDAHMMRILGSLDICISELTDRPTLDAQLAHLHDQHHPRAIPVAYFDLMERAIMHSVPVHLEEHHFDQDAWHGCFQIIKDGITGADHHE